jgi:putative hydrolase of the HAD superfamily
LALDLGGVVYRSWPDDAFYARWAEVCGCSAQAVTDCIWQETHWPLAEIGEITTEECYERIGATLGIAPVLARAFASEAFASNPDEALATYVERVRRRGVKVLAFTNNISGESELLGRPELARLFDLAVSSADARLAKPDPEFFRYAETRLGARSEDMVLVDDLLTNVEAARTVGWRAIQFRSTPSAIEEIEAALFGSV